MNRPAGMTIMFAYSIGDTVILKSDNGFGMLRRGVIDALMVSSTGSSYRVSYDSRAGRVSEWMNETEFEWERQ